RGRPRRRLSCSGAIPPRPGRPPASADRRSLRARHCESPSAAEAPRTGRLRPRHEKRSRLMRIAGSVSSGHSLRGRPRRANAGSLGPSCLLRQTGLSPLSVYTGSGLSDNQRREEVIAWTWPSVRRAGNLEPADGEDGGVQIVQLLKVPDPLLLLHQLILLT